MIDAKTAATLIGRSKIFVQKACKELNLTILGGSYIIDEKKDLPRIKKMMKKRGRKKKVLDL